MSDGINIKPPMPVCDDGFLIIKSTKFAAASGGKIFYITPEWAEDEGKMSCIPYPPKKDSKVTPPNGSGAEKSEVILKPKPDQKLKKEVLKEKEASPASLHRSPVARPAARTARADLPKASPTNK